MTAEGASAVKVRPVCLSMSRQETSVPPWAAAYEGVGEGTDGEPAGLASLMMRLMSTRGTLLRCVWGMEGATSAESASGTGMGVDADADATGAGSGTSNSGGMTSRPASASGTLGCADPSCRCDLPWTLYVRGAG